MVEDNKELIPQISYKIEKAKKEEAYTLLFESEKKKKYILSRYTPLQEAKDSLPSDLGNKETIWIFYGFAFGYVIEEVLKLCGEQTKIIVIEPEQQLLDDQIKAVNKEAWYKRENITFYTGYEQESLTRLFGEVIPSSEINNFKIISKVGYLEYYAAYYKAVNIILDEVTTNVLVQSNTMERFGSLFLTNVLKNRYAIQEGYDFLHHKDKYKNIPALVVSGGPSLSKNIKWIKDFKGLIFTGGRTLTPVLEQGVKPDFLVSVDPQNITYETLRENAENDIPLITLDQGNDKVVEANKGPQYFLAGESFIKEFLGNKEAQSIPMGGSVATVCASAAQYMGCNPIIFIGQDLAYTNMKKHADECSDKLVNGGTNEVAQDADYSKMGYKQVESVEGGKVWTTKVLITYLRWFETFIKVYTQNQFINATEGGAKMHGAEHIPFQEVVERFRHLEKPEIQHIQSENKIDVDQNIQEAVCELKELLKLIKRANKVALTLVDEYKIYKGLRVDKIFNNVQKLDKLDNEIKEYSGRKNIISYLFGTAYTELERDKQYKCGLNEKQLGHDRKIAEYSQMFYQKLEEIMQEVISIINKEMEVSESR
ncbi:MAG: motility associated factor glycosyltransferase family protein [Cellulosilyticum sp.]|nr:motility associated factor glycosyltransferase family protein [Cellulosilyticum sp.]